MQQPHDGPGQKSTDHCWCASLHDEVRNDALAPGVTRINSTACQGMYHDAAASSGDFDSSGNLHALR